MKRQDFHHLLTITNLPNTYITYITDRKNEFFLQITANSPFP